jgi:hypothetical protein
VPNTTATSPLTFPPKPLGLRLALLGVWADVLLCLAAWLYDGQRYGESPFQGAGAFMALLTTYLLMGLHIQKGFKASRVLYLALLGCITVERLILPDFGPPPDSTRLALTWAGFALMPVIFIGLLHTATDRWFTAVAEIRSQADLAMRQKDAIQLGTFGLAWLMLPIVASKAGLLFHATPGLTLIASAPALGTGLVLLVLGAARLVALLDRPAVK